MKSSFVFKVTLKSVNTYLRRVERCSESLVRNFVSFYEKCFDGNQILFLLLVESHEVGLESGVITGELDGLV